MNDDSFDPESGLPHHVLAEEGRLPIRPPLEIFDPETLSHWSITMTVAWITWKSIDAVREEWDSYRYNCADWHFETDRAARAQVEALALKNFKTGEQHPQDKDLDRRLKTGTWELRTQRESGWDQLEIKTIAGGLDAMAAREALWLFAGEGRLRAGGLECENEKTFRGNLVEIPASHWPHLRARDEPSGKAMLLGPDRIYRDVTFARLDVKSLWPKMASLAADEAASSVESRSKPRRNNNERGRPPEYKWDEIKGFAMNLVKQFGIPGPSNRKLPRQEDLVIALQDELAKKDLHPGVSTVRRYVSSWLREL